MLLCYHGCNIILQMFVQKDFEAFYYQYRYWSKIYNLQNKDTPWNFKITYKVILIARKNH